MMTAVAIALTFGSLHLDPGFRTFPEIAALIGETPTEVRCDPTIAHRMVFASARSISREGLLSALGLELVPDGTRRRLRAVDTKIEREWASDVRASLGRRYARTVALALAAADAKWGPNPPAPPEDDWMMPIYRTLGNPKATPAERAQADETLTSLLGAAIASSAEGEAAVRSLAAFSPDVPEELLERGTFVDTLPLASLPAPTLAALRRAYPALQGGPDSIVVRRREFGEARSFGLTARLGVVDPGIVVPADWSLYAFALPVNPAPTLTGALRIAETERTFRLRGYSAEIARLRSGEAEGWPLVDRYAAETPLPNFGERGSLSQIAEFWARKGHSVVMELDPGAESLSLCWIAGKLARGGDWSPRVVEDTLVLRSLVRFVNARRRFPYRGLRALEAEQRHRDPEALSAAPRAGDFGLFAALPSEAVASYARAAGPADRWESTVYRGWPSWFLDDAASHRRVLDLVPPDMLAQADALVDRLANAPSTVATEKGPVEEWRLPLGSLPPATQAAIAAEMRAHAQHESKHLLAHSPVAMAAYLRTGTLRVAVDRTPAGFRRTVMVGSETAPFDAWLYGE